MEKIKLPPELLALKLQVLYDIEKEIEKALPDMVKGATDLALKESFRKHLEETKEHSRRIERIFDILDMRPGKIKSEAIRGLIKDGEWFIDVDATISLKDAMIAAAGRNIEHLEMIEYMDAIEASDLIGLDTISDILAETLDEEKATDQKLLMAMKSNMAEADSTETELKMAGDVDDDEDFI